MKTIIGILSVLGLAISPCFAAAEDSEDIKVVLPEELMPKPKPLTDEERLRQDKARVHSELIWRLNRKLPYHNDEGLACRFNTLGMLVKLCDSISVAKVVEVEDTGSNKVPKRLVPNIKVTVNAETNLLGHLDRGGLPLTVQWWDRKRLPQKGDRWLVFVTHEDHEINMFDAMKWDFDKTKARGKPLDAAAVLGQSRGAIDLDGGKTEMEILAATTGYLQNLRQKTWDAEKYYMLLRELSLSPVKRISDDAKTDLVNFLRSCPSFDLKRVLEDEKIDEGVKDYVRLLLLPSQQTLKTP